MLDIDNEEIYNSENGETITDVDVAEKEIIKEILEGRE